MYPNELQNFIKSRNYKLGGDDLIKAISITENPQLTHIEYNAYENKYRMWDFEGNYYEFEPIFYEEYQKIKKM